MAEAKLAKLKIKRGTLIAQQQRVKEFIDSKLSKASVPELETRAHALEKYYHDFESIQSCIEELEPEEGDTIRGSFEELYFVLRPTLMVAIRECKEEAEKGSTATTKCETIVSKKLRLPEIPLPTFSGDYTQWLSYYDTFSALVHRNSALDNVTRFHYLRSSLKDGALRRIQSIEVTSDNYEIALKSLVERYQKRNVIVREHIRQLFNVPSIANKSSSSALRELIDSVNIHLRALSSLGRPVAHWDDLVIEIVLPKLDNSTLEKWNDEAPTDRLPTLEEVFKFLEKRCTHLEERAAASRSTTQQCVNSNKSPKPFRSSQQRSAFVVSENVKPQRNCTYCSGTNHVIYRCRKFLALNPKQRFDAIHQRNLCNNCLKADHTHINYESEKCRACKRSHHTLLHYNSVFVNAAPAIEPSSLTVTSNNAHTE
ncbi:uncharacterized protein LOC118756433 [Rhagoletis pomonella]|uniref:uncharacterized protein LOC118756433 n=1 Tax=Rhagoletis pomonella TaxID=28610 RepID=UPI0017808819|nr:uncharacterized protein LOC118756433 [Rhagoletis pomonella]